MAVLGSPVPAGGHRLVEQLKDGLAAIRAEKRAMQVVDKQHL